MKYWVRGTGPAVLFLHGLPTSGRLWDFVTPRLSDSFRCVVVDLPGAGGSPPFPEGSLAPERFAAEMEALRVDLGIPRWHVVGHDAGAAIAVHYAARYADRAGRIVLCSPPIFPEHQIPWFFRLLRTRGVGEVLAPIVTTFLLPSGIRMAVRRDRPGLPPIIADFCAPFRGRDGAARLLHLLRWGDPAAVLGPTAALLPSLTQPALVLSGQHDGAVPTEFAVRAAKGIRGAELHLMDCGHFLPLECPEALSEYLCAFLSKPLEH